ncbi:unnamed protein product (macronuclear) [Paramecium tetraurelia]|uniref:Transmembrane protein n=1 Tax=Paramecium tetraurelia TaxID=5888 RepID=A0EE41_PARTE|nr:uncharacterized protein GSPATT00025902001 [Paramecium tetraurelia]CAK93558.1 unnamed protein product [Paramecium tetraurelia]|eukprot:XP_001460955.1 hypothetical protein (macronuclear) [Paramecium tetraurelia strain d4-2]
MQTIQIIFFFFIMGSTARFANTDTYNQSKLAEKIHQSYHQTQQQNWQLQHQNSSTKDLNLTNQKEIQFKICSDIEDPEQCSKLHPSGIECEWNGSCLAKHQSNKIPELMKKEKSLKNLEKYTYRDQCREIFERTNCLVSKIQGLQCVWVNNQCLTNCNVISSQDLCLRNIATTNVQKCLIIKNQNDNNSRLNCSQRSSDCKYDDLNQYSCIWQNNQCQVAMCHQFQDEQKCNDQQSCNWHISMKMCLTDTELPQYDKPCDISMNMSILSYYAFLLLIFI